MDTVFPEGREPDGWLVLLDNDDHFRAHPVVLDEDKTDEVDDENAAVYYRVSVKTGRRIPPAFRRTYYQDSTATLPWRELMSEAEARAEAARLEGA